MNGTAHVALAMRTGGLLGSAVTVAFALPSGVSDLWHRRRSAGEVGMHLAKQAVGGGLAGAAAGAATTLVGAAVGGTIIPFIAGAGAAYGLKYAWDSQVQPPPASPEEAGRAAIAAAPGGAMPAEA